MSPSILTRFVNRERGLSTDTLDAICAALGLELRETRRGVGVRTTGAQTEAEAPGEPAAAGL